MALFKSKMVHKKSEYRLQFHRLSDDVRAEIWRNNFLFRESQKRMNLSDHYWRYQLIDDSCECEDVSDSGIADTRSRLPRSDDMTATSHADITPRVYLNKEVQTTDLHHDSGEESVISEKKNDSKEDEDTIKSVAQVPTGAGESTLEQNYRGSTNNMLQLSKHHSNTETEKLCLHSNEGHHKDYISHLNSSPTRNALKTHQSESKTTPVFAAFGWNDCAKNVGDQRTFNVRAPVDQVHYSALQASGKRLKDLELHLAEQLRKSRLQKSHPGIGPVNISSIWMTEYQESFCKGQRQPLARVSYRRPIVWRYT